VCQNILGKLISVIINRALITSIVYNSVVLSITFVSYKKPDDLLILNNNHSKGLLVVLCYNKFHPWIPALL